VTTEPQARAPSNTPLDADGVRHLLNTSPMRWVQIRAVAFLVVLSMIDGYDVISLSYAGPVVADALGFGKTALGAVFSSGLIGMALGSLFLAPLADRFGRRTAIISALAMMIVGGVGCAFATSVYHLAGWRVLSGLGIGTLIAVTTPLAAEFANARRRAFAVSATTMAFPLGAMIGGLVAAALMRDFGWQSVFVAKVLFASVLLPLIVFWLPESPSFLINSTRSKDTARLNAFLQDCGHARVSLPVGQGATLRHGYADLFAAGQLPVTLQLIAVNLLFAMVGYFWGSWLPSMMVGSGYSAQTASIVAATNQLAGVIGGLLLGLAAKWVRLRSLTVAALVATGLAIAIFGYASAQLTLLTLSAASCGFCLHAGIAGLYSTIATSFEDHVRASGTGLVIGVGRISSSIAPLVAGWMFANGYGRNAVSIAFAALAVCAGLVLARPRHANGAAASS
jgi:MFS transporter, AAHS family, 4-hydroxybenzoate transporter